ncbi:MAG TPA: DUF3828 domain-containing protein [Candidatus Binataceae bacterium]|nr:DUF3828 domain-containing protein [Candidatus Binataceae bacterium]
MASSAGMKPRHSAAFLLIVVFILAFRMIAPAADNGTATAQSADAFLHSIYDRYTGPQDKAPPIDYANTRELQRYFEVSLADIIHADFIRAQKADDVPTLDGDPFIDAQDWEIKSFQIHVTPVDANHATASVKFTNAGTPKSLQVQLVRVAGDWKIHDIDYGGSEGTLRGMFKAAGSAH